MRIRRHLTYANAMSSLAVFLILGGATAFAATKIGSSRLKANSVRTGKIAKEAVTGIKIKNGAVGTGKIADNAVTGEKVDEWTLAQVPNAANAKLLDGIPPTAFSRAASSGSQAVVLDGGSGTASSVSITAPRQGYLLAVASGGVFNDGSTKTFTGCHLNLDGDDVAASDRGTFVSEDVPRSVCATNALVPVAAGEHQVSFNFTTVPGEGGVEGAELDLVFIPFAG